ncbi:unnamed protein product [Cunninghamella echinulata]
MSFLKESNKLQNLSTSPHSFIQHPAPTKVLPSFTDDIQQLINSRQRRSFSVPPKRPSDDEWILMMMMKWNNLDQDLVQFSPAPPEIFEYPASTTDAPKELKDPSVKPIPLPWYPTS